MTYFSNIPIPHTRGQNHVAVCVLGPESDNVPPWAENKGGWWYCRARWKYLDHKHAGSGQHVKRVYYWIQQPSVALSAAWSAARSAEAGPSAAKSATEWADRESVNREDLAELLVC